MGFVSKIFTYVSRFLTAATIGYEVSKSNNYAHTHALMNLADAQSIAEHNARLKSNDASADTVLLVCVVVLGLIVLIFVLRGMGYLHPRPVVRRSDNIPLSEV